MCRAVPCRAVRSVGVGGKVTVTADEELVSKCIAEKGKQVGI